MNYQIIEKKKQKYILLDANGSPMQPGEEATELFRICVENKINLLLIYGERLSDDFLHLETGIAGIAFQKFAMYNIRAAIILDEARMPDRFKELLIESDRGNTFRNFSDLSSAEKWLLRYNDRMGLRSS